VTASPVVAVVGGGIAGLAAARSLALAGAQVVVLEPERLGGKLRTSEFAGRPVDEGADAFLARVPWAVDLACDLGLGDRLVSPATGRAHVFVDGRLRPLPAEHLMGVPTDLDAPDLAAILSPEGLAAARRDLAEPGSPPAGGADDGDEAIGPFLRRRLGAEVLDRLAGPLVGGINGGDVERLSLAAVTPQLDAAARAGEASLIRACAAQRAAALAAQPPGEPAPVFLAPAGGMASLIDALVADLSARDVDLRVGLAARALEPTAAGGWRVIADPTSGHGVVTDMVVEADAVVVASPAPVAAALLRDHAPEAAAHLASIRHASVAMVALAVEVEDLPSGGLEGSGLLVARSEGLLVTACSWASSKWAALAPEQGDGTVVLRASAGCDGDTRIADLSDHDLVDHVIDDLIHVMRYEGTPTEVRVTRWPSSFPQYDVGHLARVAEIEAQLGDRIPSVAVAGNALRGVGIPASIRSGQLAADQVLGAVLAR
jgi:oxygen-dependent protoporphyrinogen oxidase